MPRALWAAGVKQCSPLTFSCHSSAGSAQMNGCHCDNPYAVAYMLPNRQGFDSSWTPCRADYPDDEPLELAPPGAVPLMETGAPSGAAPGTRDELTGTITQLDAAVVEVRVTPSPALGCHAW